jgi:hypothetical protein
MGKGTYVNIDIWCRLGELDVHWEKFILVVSLSFEFERAASIVVVNHSNSPF